MTFPLFFGSTDFGSEIESDCPGQEFPKIHLCQAVIKTNEFTMS